MPSPARRVLLRLRKPAGATVRICICLVTAATGLMIATASKDAPIIREYALRPFSQVFLFVLFALAAIVFWSAALFPLIVDERARWRGVVFRGIDYVWYLSALAAAALIANEMQVSQLRTRM